MIHNGRGQTEERKGKGLLVRQTQKDRPKISVETASDVDRQVSDRSRNWLTEDLR